MLSFRAAKVLMVCHISISCHKKLLVKCTASLTVSELNTYVFIFKDFPMKDNSVTIPFYNKHGCKVPEEASFYLNANYYHHKPFEMQQSVDILI